MPMGTTNAHAAFVAMVCKFETAWDALYHKRCQKKDKKEWEWLKAKMKTEYKETTKQQAPDQLKLNSIEETSWEPNWDRSQEASRPGLAVIVDDILLFARSTLVLFHLCIRSPETPPSHREITEDKVPPWASRICGN